MLMLSASNPDDVINVVQAKFTSSEIVLSVLVNVSLLYDEDGSTNVNENDNDHRILAIVKHDTSFALFVLISEKIHPVYISDLTIETAIPIDDHFYWDTQITNSNSTDHLIFIINYNNLKAHYFVIEVGKDSCKFAAEIIHSKQLSQSQVSHHLQDRDRPWHSSRFDWLEKYPNLVSMDNDDSYNDDIVLSRQKIAQGQSSASNRESLLKYQLKLKEPEYTQQQEFLIFVGTWNVNGQPPTIPLKPWLSSTEDPPDVYAVGFQEIDLSKEAFIFNDTPREAEWQKFVLEGVQHPDAKYRIVAHSRIVGILLIVLINSKHYSYIKNIAIDAVGTGLLGKMGNKGGVAVRLELHNTSICFVNSHLAAHVEEFQRRNQDYKDINARINFRRYPQAIKDHDHVYWLGDLNYRITELNTAQVKTLLQRNELTSLLKADQLNQQKERGNVLFDYTEGDITFPPTYKYDLFTDTFDTSEKARPPAWTDRILWRGKGIYLQSYRSHMELRSSDHKPVSAVFRSEVNVVDITKYRRVHEDLLKRMDKLENEFLPQVTIDQTEIIFDIVKFQEMQVREIIVANTGQVPVEFEFIKKLDEENYCKEWLRIVPYYGTINPGEKCDIRLEVLLESDLMEIYDILVLHLKGGKDMFITVSGKCQRSSFTTSMTVLCRCPLPILQLSSEIWSRAAKKELPVLYSIPREIWFLVDHLYKHGLKTKELFESSALHEELSAVRDCIDFGSVDSLPGTIYAAAESLLLFLSYTKEPVIPYELHDICIAASSNFFSCKKIILQKLPDIHRNVFLYLCMFLQEFLKHSSENGYDSRTIASLFGEILLRDQSRNAKPQACRGKATFVYNFIENDLSPLIIPES